MPKCEVLKVANAGEVILVKSFWWSHLDKVKPILQRPTKRKILQSSLDIVDIASFTEHVNALGYITFASCSKQLRTRVLSVIIKAMKMKNFECVYERDAKVNKLEPKKEHHTPT